MWKTTEVMHRLCPILFLLPYAHAFTATCNDNNTITANIPFERRAQVLELTYGSCNETSTAGVTGLTQDPSDFSFRIHLDMSICGTDQVLGQGPNLNYDQNVFIRVGRSVTDMMSGMTLELTYEHFEIDSDCTIDDTYDVIFSYGNMTQDEDGSSSQSGNVSISFIIRAYDESFTTRDFAHSTVAGNMIHLGLTLADGQPFNFENHEFAPLKCSVVDTAHSFEYTLFNAMISGGCTNNDVDLAVGYNSTTKMWQFSHILFLLGDYEESSFMLKCKVKVCVIGADSDCDTVKNDCGIESATTTVSETADFVMEAATSLQALFGFQLSEVDTLVSDILVQEINLALGDDVISVEVAPGEHDVASIITSIYGVNVTYLETSRRRRKRNTVVSLENLFLASGFLGVVQGLLDDEIRDYADNSGQVYDSSLTVVGFREGTLVAVPSGDTCLIEPDSCETGIYLAMYDCQGGGRCTTETGVHSMNQLVSIPTGESCQWESSAGLTCDQYYLTTAGSFTPLCAMSEIDAFAYGHADFYGNCCIHRYCPQLPDCTTVHGHTVFETAYFTDNGQAANAIDGDTDGTTSFARASGVGIDLVVNVTNVVINELELFPLTGTDYSGISVEIVTDDVIKSCEEVFNFVDPTIDSSSGPATTFSCSNDRPVSAILVHASDTEVLELAEVAVFHRSGSDAVC